MTREERQRANCCRTTRVSPSVGRDDFKISAVPKESRGTTALAALRESRSTTADGEDALLTKEEAQHEEVTGEVSEEKGKPQTSVNLPGIFAEKVHRTKVLVECERDALDLSGGDMGAVWRFSVSSGKEKGEDDLFRDLKGIIYKTTIVPSNTFFVVNVGHAEAKAGRSLYDLKIWMMICRHEFTYGHTNHFCRRSLLLHHKKKKAIMNDFMQLQPDTDQVQDEILVEASGPVDSDADEYDSKKKKTPTKQQKQKKVPSKGGKDSRAKGSGKGAPSKKPRTKAKGTAKKPSRTKSATAKSSKSKQP